MAKKLKKFVTKKTGFSKMSVNLLYVLLFFIVLSISAFFVNKNQNSKKQLSTQIEPITHTPTPTSGINPKTGWKIYRNPEREYQFEYPSDFKIAPESFSNVTDPVIQFTHFVSVTGDDFEMSIMSHHNPKSLNTLEWLNFLKEKKLDSWTGTTGPSFINTKVGNEDAFSFWGGGKNLGMLPGNSKQSSAVYYVFTTHNKFSFRIHFTSPSGFSQEKFNLFKKVLSTFTFTTPVNITKEKKSNGLLYTDHGEGYSITYPFSWKSESACNGGPWYDAYLCIKSPSLTLSPIPNVLSGELITIGSKDSSVFAGSPKSVHDFCKTDTMTKLTSCTEMQLNGTTAFKKVWENFPFIDVAVLKDDEIKYVIRLQYAQKLINTSHKFTEFENIVSSFNFTE